MAQRRWRSSVSTAALRLGLAAISASARKSSSAPGGIGAFVRTYRVWRAQGTWWGWQGAGWFLMMVMLLTLTMGFPVLAGPLEG